MKVVCSYCKKFLRDKPPLDDHRTSHGVCEPCFERFTKQFDSTPLDHYLDGFEAPVVVVRGDSRVVAINRAMESWLGKGARQVLGLLGGEAVECAYARLPGGCGRTEHCETCAIRRAVTSTMATGESVVDAIAYVLTDSGKTYLRISTERIDGTVRVTIREAESARASDRVQG